MLQNLTIAIQLDRNVTTHVAFGWPFWPLFRWRRRSLIRFLLLVFAHFTASLEEVVTTGADGSRPP